MRFQGFEGFGCILQLSGKFRHIVTRSARNHRALASGKGKPVPNMASTPPQISCANETQAKRTNHQKTNRLSAVVRLSAVRRAVACQCGSFNQVRSGTILEQPPQPYSEPLQTVPGRRDSCWKSFDALSVGLPLRNPPQRGSFAAWNSTRNRTWTLHEE